MKGILLLWLISFSAYSQSDSTQTHSGNKGYNTDQINPLLQRRERSEQYFNFTKELVDPSTISFKGMDFHRNFEKSQQKKGYILNADIQIPIALGGKRWYFFTHKNGGVFNAIQIIPQFKVRIFTDDTTQNDLSNPVRTPSYLPRITYMFAPMQWQNLKRNCTFMVSAFHHSNGQDGPEFFAQDSSFAFWKKGLVNTYNGNFGENIVFEFGFGMAKDHSFFKIKNGIFHRIKKQQELLNKGSSSARKIFSSAEYGLYRAFGKVNFEWHPKNYSNSNFLINNIYARKRLNFSTGFSFLTFSTEYVKKMNTENKLYYDILEKDKVEVKKEQVRVILNGNLLLDKQLNLVEAEGKLNRASLKNRINLSATSYIRVPGTGSSAVFLQLGYFGSDPYNIYFQQRQVNIRIGLSLLYFTYH